MEIDLQRAYDEYENLSDEEKEMIRKVMTGKARSVIRKVSLPTPNSVATVAPTRRLNNV